MYPKNIYIAMFHAIIEGPRT